MADKPFVDWVNDLSFFFLTYVNALQFSVQRKNAKSEKSPSRTPYIVF